MSNSVFAGTYDAELKRIEVINGDRMHVILDDGSGMIIDLDTALKIAGVVETMRSGREAHEAAAEDFAYELNATMSAAGE